MAHGNFSGTRTYFSEKELPFPGLVDQDHRVFDLYEVESRLTSLGQRPALFIIDKSGIIRFAHLASQQWQIPTNGQVLSVLRGLAG